MSTPSKYIFDGLRHSAYDDTVDIADHLSFHIDGYKPHRENTLQAKALALFGKTAENPYFAKLIDRRRPSEAEGWRVYRRAIYSSITRQPMFKVLTSLNKITRAEDWKIDYSQADTPKRIKEDEQLEKYAEANYPMFGSVTNWAYSFGLKKILSDPNGMIVTLPVSFAIPSAAHYSPFADFIPSKDVLWYSEESIFYKTDRTILVTIDKEPQSVPVFIHLTKEGIFEVWQNSADTLAETHIFKGKFTVLPAWKAGGNLVNIKDNVPIYESYLSPMLPSLDEAAREYSDLQAEIVQHVHSTLWSFMGDNCDTCKGVGFVIKTDAEGGMVACGDCKGRGAMPVSPFKQINIKLSDPGKEPVPVPPAGYIEKQTEIAKLQDERVKNHISDSLAALNMEFLSESPLNESGKAKEVDRDELNNFVYGIAHHLVKNNLKRIYKWTIAWRYGDYGSKLSTKELESMMPALNVPEKFDLLSDNAIISQLLKMKESDVDPTIIRELQIELINKKFRESPATRKKLLAQHKLNPFPTKSTEELIDLEMAGGVSKLDFVAAIYGDTIIDELVSEDKGFLDLGHKEQKAKFDIAVAAKEKTLVKIPDATPSPE